MRTPLVLGAIFLLLCGAVVFSMTEKRYHLGLRINEAEGFYRQIGGEESAKFAVFFRKTVKQPSIELAVLESDTGEISSITPESVVARSVAEVVDSCQPKFSTGRETMGVPRISFPLCGLNKWPTPFYLTIGFSGAKQLEIEVLVTVIEDDFPQSKVPEFQFPIMSWPSGGE